MRNLTEDDIVLLRENTLHRNDYPMQVSKSDVDSKRNIRRRFAWAQRWRTTGVPRLKSCYSYQKNSRTWLGERTVELEFIETYILLSFFEELLSWLCLYKKGDIIISNGKCCAIGNFVSVQISFSNLYFRFIKHEFWTQRPLNDIFSYYCWGNHVSLKIHY